jgi:ureidoglycolate dehydrogenase (NAD+)
MEQYDFHRCTREDLETFLMAILRAAGCDGPSAAAVTRAVVDASARAYDTHGVRLVPWYVQCLQGGRVNGAPQIAVTRKAPGIVHVDADNGFGHAASYRAIDALCDIATEQGIAVATVGRSSHHGATGCYTFAAAKRGFAALAVTHADSVVVPHDGVAPFFGTNPISFAVPLEDEEPLVLDMATSSIPLNRVLLRRSTGAPLPPDVAVDAHGRATTDAHQAAALLPLGGQGFGYKGAGLACMVDLLCSAFTGMGHGATFPSFNGPDYTRPIEIGHFFLVMQPSLFQALSTFNASVGALVRDLRSQAAKPGTAVQAPSDLEKAEARRRQLDGIPLDPVTWREFEALGERYGCALRSQSTARAGAAR